MAKNTAPGAAAFTKEQLVASAKYAGSRDLISALLDSKNTYTLDEVDKLIENYKKGKVS